MAEPFVLHPDGSLQARWLAHEGLVDLRCLEDTVDAVQAILQIELPRLANRLSGSCGKGPSAPPPKLCPTVSIEWP